MAAEVRRGFEDCEVMLWGKVGGGLSGLASVVCCLQRVVGGVAKNREWMNLLKKGLVQTEASEGEGQVFRVESIGRASEATMKWVGTREEGGKKGYRQRGRNDNGGDPAQTT